MYFRLHENIYYGSLRILIFPPDFCLYVDIYLLFGMLVGMCRNIIGQHNIFMINAPL